MHPGCSTCTQAAAPARRLQHLHAGCNPLHPGCNPMHPGCSTCTQAATPCTQAATPCTQAATPCTQAATLSMHPGAPLLLSKHLSSSGPGATACPYTAASLATVEAIV